MAEEEKKKEGSPIGDFWWLIFVLFILFVAWFATGGPSRADLGSLFLQPPGGIFGGDASTTIGAIGTSSSAWLPIAFPDISSSVTEPAFNKQIDELRKNPSFFQGLVGFEGTSNIRSSDPAQEYVSIYASGNNSAGVNITGWRIMSVKTGAMAIIGTAVDVPITAVTITPGAVVLGPGERAVISSGRSPIGVSFRTNKCSGYLAQFQTFTPAISPLCPNAMSELFERGGSGISGERACLAAAQKIGACRILATAPAGVSGPCSVFLTQTLTYNGCVNAHRGDPDFKQAE